MTSRYKRMFKTFGRKPRGEFVVPRWKNQAIGARSRPPKKITLPRITMQEAK